MSRAPFAPPLEPPYYAVVFTSQRTDAEDGYGAMADRMVELAHRQDGFLGVESARDENGFGITVSYWRDQAAIARWRADAEHRVAQQRGRRDWYERFVLRVALVERCHPFERQP